MTFEQFNKWIENQPIMSETIKMITTLNYNITITENEIITIDKRETGAHLKCCIDELLNFDIKDGYAVFKIKVGK